MVWGVVAALMANVLYSTGFVLEKRALVGLPQLNAGRPAQVVRLLISSPLWIGGALMLALGFAAQLVVYRTLPIAAAQGIFVSGLVMLLLLSSAVLGEQTNGRQWRGMIFITLALLMVVASLHGGVETISGSAPVGRLLAVCLPSLAAGLWLYGAAERRARRRHRQPTSGVAYGIAVGLLYGVSSVAIKGVSGLSTGDLGSVALGLISSPYPYLLTFTGITGLVLSQTALQRCRASLIVPVCTIVTCVFAAVAGTYGFGEPLPDNPLRLALRLGGTALAVCVLLTLPRHDPHGGTKPPGGRDTHRNTMRRDMLRSNPMEADDPMLRILACPIDKGALALLPPDEAALYNPRLRRRYPIVDGIPQLLPSSGEQVSREEHEALCGRIAAGR